MARYPEYRASRQSFGINVLGTLVVELEASDGTVGFAVTTENGEYTLVKDLPVDDFSQKYIDKTLAELEEERAGVAHLLG